jgi:hypothetical protein
MFLLFTGALNKPIQPTHRRRAFPGHKKKGVEFQLPIHSLKTVADKKPYRFEY